MTILTELNNPSAVTDLFNTVYVISKNFYTMNQEIRRKFLCNTMKQSLLVQGRLVYKWATFWAELDVII